MRQVRMCCKPQKTLLNWPSRRRQREDDDRGCASAVAEHHGASAAGGTHVLFAVHGVGHDSRRHRASCVESIQHLAVARIQGYQIAAELTGKHQPAVSGRYRRHEGLIRVILPTNTAGGDVDRREQSARVGLSLVSASHVKLTRNQSRLGVRLGGGTRIDDGNI